MKKHETITAKAHAKINLFLRVCGRRDDGFHEIQTLFQTVGLADELSFTLSNGDADGLEVVAGNAPTGPDNLVLRALALLRAKAGGDVPPLQAVLDKQVPSGAGLGGGSADAAATLVAVDRLLKLGLGHARLTELAAELGADVPFFIRGGAQLGAGRGERLTPVEPLGEIPLVIVKPAFSISTAAAYGQFAGRELEPPLAPEELRARVDALRERRWAEALENSFEAALFPRHPALRQIKERLLGAGCAAALLSGSGSALFGVAPSHEAAREIARELSGEYEFAHAAAPQGLGAKRFSFDD